MSGNSSAGYTITQPDGSRWSYTFIVTNTAGTFIKAMMTEMWNAFGQMNRLDYHTYDPATQVVRLKCLVDGDGRTNWVYYNTNHPLSTNLISYVVNPFGHTVALTHDDGGFLTNITDVVGLSSSVSYAADGTASRLATPYGTNQFLYTDTPYLETPPYGRSVRVLEPDGSCQLHLYTNGAPGVPSGYSSGGVPVTSPFANTFENAGLDQRNSFHWNRQQYAALSATNTASLNAADFRIATLKHWLKAESLNSNPGVGYTLSLLREPSQDGTAEGQITWFDYEGKTNAAFEGSVSLPLFVACVLPDGTTQFTRTTRNDYGWRKSETSTYTGGLGVALRTNTFDYSGDQIDLLRSTNALGTLVTSNAYNSAHQVVTNYDALGQQTVYVYDSSHHQVSVLHPSGLVTTNDYGADGYPAQAVQWGIATNNYIWSNALVYTHTDPRGLTVTNTWDALNRLRRVDFPDHTFITNHYEKLDLVRTIDRLGFTNTFGYDRLRRLAAATNANGVVTRHGYCGCGAFTSVTNAWATPVELISLYTYDYQGNRLYAVNPDQTVTNWFDALGRVICTGNELGYRWFGYNNQGLLTVVSNAYGPERTITYDILDRPIYVTDANGVTVTNTYDALGRLRSRGLPDGGVEYFGYSPRGLVAHTNQLSLTNFFVYDEAGRKVFETNANWEVLRYTNSPAGDLLALVDGKGQVTKWNYDEYGRVTNKLNQAGALILQYTYDVNGRLTSRWSAAKGTTYYAQDAVGNLTGVDYPASPDVNYAYDWLNRLTNMVDAVGSTTYTYTPAGRLLTEDGPFDSDTLSNVYNNALRNMLALEQPSDVWWTGFGYDYAGRLGAVQSPAGTFYYSFAGPASRLTQKLWLPNGSYITNAYDNVARLRFTKLNNSTHTTLDAADYSYNPAHQRLAYTNAAGTYVTNGYDRIGQLKLADSSVNAEDRGYAYDPAWNLNFRTNNGTLETFGVNNLNELTTMPGASLSYDANGNLTGDGTYTYAYDDENQLVSRAAAAPASGAVASAFAYDGLRRLRSRAEYVGNGSTWVLQNLVNYIYDGRRVIEERDGNNWPQVGYTWGTDLSGALEGAGGIGGLLARTHDFTNCSATLTYRLVNDSGYCLYDLSIWDAYQTHVSGGSVSQNAAEEYSFPGVAGRAYQAFGYSCDYYGLQVFNDSFTGTLGTHEAYFDSQGGVTGSESGDPLCDTGRTSGWLTHNYYHADGNGNVTALASGLQTLSASYRYDPFGNTLGQSGGLADANTYRFSTKEYHANSGLYYYSERWYAPGVQRWLNRDPIEEAGGINLYGYVGNNPISRIDPLGLTILVSPSPFPGQEGTYGPYVLNIPDGSSLVKTPQTLDPKDLCQRPPAKPEA